MDTNRLLLITGGTLLGSIITILPPVKKMNERIWKKIHKAVSNAAIGRKT